MDNSAVVPISALLQLSGGSFVGTGASEAEEVARSFEAYFLDALWRTAQASVGGTKGSTYGAGGDQAWDSLIASTMANALSDGGGLGIGRMVYEQLMTDSQMEEVNHD